MHNPQFENLSTVIELIKLGMAVKNLPRRGPEEQDQRGWNRCLDAIEKEYKGLENDLSSN